MLLKIMSKHPIFMTWVNTMFLQVYYVVFSKIGTLKNYILIWNTIFQIAETSVLGIEKFLTFNLFFLLYIRMLRQVLLYVLNK